MALVKKVDANWYPNNDLNFKVDDVIDITYPDQLVEEGKVKLVDEPKEVAPEPDKSVLTCSECNFVAKSEFGLKSHSRKHA